MSDESSEAKVRRLRNQLGVSNDSPGDERQLIKETESKSSEGKGPPTRPGRPATAPSLPRPRHQTREPVAEQAQQPESERAEAHDADEGDTEVLSVSGLLEIPSSAPPPPPSPPVAPGASSQTGPQPAPPPAAPKPILPPTGPQLAPSPERTVKSPAPEFHEEEVSAVFLADEDLLEVNTSPNIVRGAGDGAGPAAGSSASPASVAGLESAAADLKVVTDEAAWEAGRRFYLAEATAAAEHQPERGALMWIEAARLAEHGGAPLSRVLSHLDAALDLCGDGALLPAIRRTVMRLGDHQRALDLARREIALGGEPGRRAAVMVEGAALVRHVEQRPEEALELLDGAVAAMPGSVPSLSMLAGLLVELRRPRRLAEVLGQLVEALSAPGERALHLYGLGSLFEHVLEERDQGEAAYVRALEADPENLPAVIALCSSYERSGRWEQLCRRLEHWAELAGDESLSARLLMRAGLVHFEVTGDLEAAARCFAGAARAEPDDRAARRRLAEVYAATARAQELVGVLRQVLGQTLDGEGRAALCCRIGWQLHNRLGDLDGAIEAYEASTQESPGYLPAVQALGTIFRQQGDFERLVAIDLAEGEVTDPPAARAIRYLEAAEILADRLGRTDEAVDACRRALDLQPGSPLVFWQLSRLLEREGRHGELAELLAAQIELAADVKTQHHLRRQLAALQAGPLGAADKAIETLEQARRSDRTRGAAVVLSRLLEREGRHAELVTLLLAEAEDTSDPAEAECLRLRAAGLLDQTLDEPDRALEVYRTLFEVKPGVTAGAQSAAALRAAGRIYHRLGRWKELIELHRRELSGAGSGAAAGAAVHCRIARIYEEELGDRDRAITAYRAALGADGGNTPALAALERLLRSNQRWPDLLKVLLRFAEVRAEPVARVDALCRAAEIAELQLGDLDQAAELHRRAWEIGGPGALQPIFGLVSVLRRQERFGPLAEVLGELSEALEGEGAAAQFRLLGARIEELRLNKQPAHGFYEGLLQTLPQGDRLREELTRVKRQGGEGDLAVWLERRGAECADPALAVAYLLEGALLMELGDDQPGDNLALCEQAHHRRPDDPLVLWALERAVWRHGDLPRLAHLCEEEAKLEIDPLHKTLQLSAAAAVFFRAGLGGEAARTARLALATDSRCLPALRLLAQLAEVAEDWGALADISDQLAAACSHRSNRLEASLRAAELWAERIGDDTRALSSLKFALATEPTDETAFTAAEAIYRRRGEHAELSLLFEQRIKASTDVDSRLRLLRQHADLLQQELKQPNRAIGLLKQLLEQRPDDEEALGQLAELHALKEHWSDAATVLLSLIERTADDQRRYRAQLRLAELYFTRLHDPVRAHEVLEQVLQERPADIQAKQLLVDLAVNGGNWAEAQRMLEELATAEETRMRVWALSRLSDVANIGLRDQELRRRYESEALTEGACDRDLLAQLAEGYWARRQQRRLLLLGEEIIKQTTRAEVVVPLRVLVARLLLEEGSDASHALDLLRDSLVAEPDNEEVQLLFAQALEASGDDESAVQGYRRILESTVDCVPAHQGLARLFARLDRAELSAAAASVLEMFGAADADETVSARTLEDGAPPPGKIDLLGQGGALAPDLRPVAGLIEAAQPYLGEIYPLEGQREALAPSHPAAVGCQRLATALGVGAVRAAIGHEPGAIAGVGNPIPLLLDGGLAEAPQSARFRLWVGRALCAAASGLWLIERLSDGELDELLTALCTARPSRPSTQRLRKQVARALPRRLRKQLEAEAVPPTGQALWARLREHGHHQVDRIGLVVCRSPRVAVSELAQAEGLGGRLNDIPRLAGLVRFAVSDELAALARRLWDARAASAGPG